MICPGLFERSSMSWQIGGKRALLIFTWGPFMPGFVRSRFLGELYGEEDPRHHVLGVYAWAFDATTIRQRFEKGRAYYAKIKRLCLQLIDLEPRHHNLLTRFNSFGGVQG